MTWYTGIWRIIDMGLQYMLTLWSNVCMCYMGLGSNGCFIAEVALTGSHYKTDIISNVGHLRRDLVMALVLCTVAYNIRGTGVLLQVPWDSTTVISPVDHTVELWLSLYIICIYYISISHP